MRISLEPTLGDSVRQSPSVMQRLAVLSQMYSRHLVSPENVHRSVDALLSAKGVKHLSQADIAHLDQDHFRGVEATAMCVKRLGLGPTSRVLDIGSGLGGPARWIASTAGSRVFGIDIQGDRVREGHYLNQLTNLDGLVTLDEGDVVEMPAPGQLYTHIFSFLAILHVWEKVELLSRLGSLLVTGGLLFIEDYVRDRDLTGSEETTLLNTIACPGLLTLADYQLSLERGGLKVVDYTDMTSDWSALARERYAGIGPHASPLAEMCSQDAIGAAATLYRAVWELFEGGVVQGVRLIAERPATGPGAKG